MAALIPVPVRILRSNSLGIIRRKIDNALYEICAKNPMM